jgi:hypothetical protein
MGQEACPTVSWSNAKSSFVRCVFDWIWAVAQTGQTTTAQHKAGEFSWGSPVKHMEQNNMDHTFEAIVVEFKS